MKKSDSIVDTLLSRPSTVFAFLTLFIFLGMVGYTKIHHKLFPDSNYPQIAVVVVQNGASSKSMATNIAVPIEEELYTLDKVRRVFSTTMDEVSVINAEFEYAKDIDAAANDVSNALEKVRNRLPANITSPQIIKITSATAPIVTLSLSPKTDAISLSDIRELAETTLKKRLLKIDGVSNVDIFGGYKKEVQVVLDKSKMESYGLSLPQVLSAIAANNQDFAVGFINNESSRYLIKALLKRETITQVKEITVAKSVRLGDIAAVSISHFINNAEYFGNGKPAIAMAVQREEDADIIKTIDRVEQEIASWQSTYANLAFEVSDTQKETILQSTQNMFESLRDAIIMSTVVVFFFLASFRQVLVVLLTIPIVYTATIALMWIVGIEFNVVTLTAVILALGLLLDDTVVVMENIERHFRELHDDIRHAVFNGTKEIMFADLSGTVTTMIALAPMLFIGGYPQTVFQPLVGTLLLALAASYVISITAVPLLSLKILAINHPILLKSEKVFHKGFHRLTDAITHFFISAVRLALENRKIALLYFGGLLFLFITSIKGVMPVVGRELMPPMDTGAIKIAVKMDPNLPIGESEAVVTRIHEILHRHGKVLRISTAIGSEPGVMTIGSGSGIDAVSINVTYVDRYRRIENIWQIARNLRREISSIVNIKEFEVVDYGATALSNIRANLDVTLYSDNIGDLLRAGEQVEAAMYKTQGIVSVSRSWYLDKAVYDLKVDEETAFDYGLSTQEILTPIKTVLQGSIVSSYPRQNSLDYPMRIWVDKAQRDNIDAIRTTNVMTGKGLVKLEKFVTMSKVTEPNIITREGLEYTLNIYGYREKAAISHIMDSFDAQMDEAKLPPSVTLEQTGDIKQFLSSAKRMAGAIGFAVVLIFLALIILFGSIRISVMILLSIPLTIIGASWLMLIFGYHTSMPAMMGFILLSGIIVNNAILLIHFALERMKAGLSKREAMLESIKIRTRPVLMTAFAVTAGMLPVAMGNAIGLERLAPLGTVAIGGLIVGTFLTLLFIPLIFVWSTKEHNDKKEGV